MPHDARETFDIGHELTRVVVRRMAEGAHPDQIAAGFALCLKMLSDEPRNGRPLADLIRELIVVTAALNAMESEADA